jgi:hypothetical protein
MKSIIKSVLICGAMGLTFVACKKDANNPVVSTKNAAITLTASSSTITPDTSTKGATAVTFKWDSVNYNIKAPVTYVLQADLAAHSFSKPVGVIVGADMYSYSYADSDLNALALKVGDSSSGTIQVRILSYLQTGAYFYDSVYSNVVTITVNPYIVVAPLVLSYAYVPGAYQGWSPNTAPLLASINANNFEGFVRINASGTLEFKVTSAPDWTHNNYGDGGTMATTGNITTDALSLTGGNLTVPAYGYYFMQTDFTALTFTGTLINSFVALGSATSNNPIPLTYDTVANVWSAKNVALSAGTLQYIANPTATDASKLTFGQGTKDSYHVDRNAAAPITVATAGTYDITLVLTSPLNYTDTLTKH